MLALKRAGARGLVPGDEVIVSLSRSEMTRWCLLLFGPALVWILLVVGADLTRASAAADGTLAGVLLAGLVTIPAASSWWLRRRPGADRVKLGLDVQNRVDEAVTQAVKWP